MGDDMGRCKQQEGHRVVMNGIFYDLGAIWGAHVESLFVQVSIRLLFELVSRTFLVPFLNRNLHASRLSKKQISCKVLKKQFSRILAAYV